MVLGLLVLPFSSLAAQEEEQGTIELAGDEEAIESVESVEESVVVTDETAPKPAAAVQDTPADTAEPTVSSIPKPTVTVKETPADVAEPTVTSIPKPTIRSEPDAVISPYIFSVIEDFEAHEPGATPGVLKRVGGDSNPQFRARVVSAGKGLKCLALSGIPAGADLTAWSCRQARDLKAYSGVSVRVRASRPLAGLKLGIVGGGYLYHVAPVGRQWDDVRLDFSEACGRGAFNPANVTEIVITAFHGEAEPVDLFVDAVRAWRPRVPPPAPRRRLNLDPVPGPLGWRIDQGTVNCAAASPGGEGVALNFWPARAPYEAWPVVSAWRRLPRGLEGTRTLSVRAGLEPGRPGAALKFVLREKGGESFTALREAPAADSVISIPISEFVPDCRANSGAAPGAADGKLSLAAVDEWRIEIIPLTEAGFEGTLRLSEAWACTAAPQSAAPRMRAVAAKRVPQAIRARPGP